MHRQHKRPWLVATGNRDKIYTQTSWGALWPLSLPANSSDDMSMMSDSAQLKRKREDFDASATCARAVGSHLCTKSEDRGRAPRPSKRKR